MVAVTADLTHQSEPNEDWPAPDGCEVIRVTCSPIPEGRGGAHTPYYQWIERQHRDGMARVDVARSDVVLISDVDEIPDPTRLDRIAAAAEGWPVAVPMRMHGFALNYLYPTAWRGTTASIGSELAPQAHRSWRHKLPGIGAGWHLSWMGDLAEKERKLRSFSHAELADLDLENCYQRGIHANGEVMRQLTRDEVLALDWPEAFNKFPVPASWWAPEEV
jgi:hypothetical protein